jgi:hypothetical protein
MVSVFMGSVPDWRSRNMNSMALVAVGKLSVVR